MIVLIISILYDDNYSGHSLEAYEIVAMRFILELLMNIPSEVHRLL